jgi:hypothetical protein
MPGPFDVTAATNTIRLDAQRRGEAAFTVFNNSGRALRGRATLVAATPAIVPWLALEGANERDFDVAATQQFSVQIAAPPDAAPGVYTFRLDALDVALPDEGLSTGPSVNFEVPAPPPPPPPKRTIPWWIWLVIGGVVLLVIIGIVAFLLLRQPDAAKFDGQWVTNFGTMTLTHNGSKLNGNFHNAFDNSNGTLDGTVSGSAFTGTWIGNGAGSLQMTLGGDGKTLDGQRNGTDKWCGARPGVPFAAGCSYAGVWSTSVGFPVALELTRTDTTVTGIFTFTLGTTFTGAVTGTVTYPGAAAETRLNGTYLLFTTPGGGNQTGPLQYFLLGFNALQFQGNTNGSAWCGARPGQALPTTCLRTGPGATPRDLPGGANPLLPGTPGP